jgi:hypothetical protein
MFKSGWGRGVVGLEGILGGVAELGVLERGV